jgi:hypothetical protein
VDHNITAYSQSRHHDNHLHSFICYVGFCRIDVRNLQSTILHQDQANAVGGSHHQCRI